MPRYLRIIPLLVALLVAATPFSIHATQQKTMSEAARNAGDAYLRALAAAAEAYSERDFSKALDKLDIADQIAPNIPDTWNLRGAIYAEQHAFEKAEDAFETEGKLTPGDFWPPYNIAELLLMEKKYAQAAAAFQRLEVYAGHEELVQFKIIFADLLMGNMDAAKPVLDAMKFPCDTPAYYYAHAAWEFAHKNEKDGTYFVNAGLKVFGLDRCLSFYDALAQVKWVPMRNADGTVPVTDELSNLPAVNSAPEPSGTP
jgi:tetratricopeptide (TPR) repeat protein